MKKRYITGFLCVLMIASLPLTVGQTNQELTNQSIEEEPQSIIGVTFIAGIIMNPQQVGNYIQAKALLLVYYDRGLIFKDSGVVIGYKQIRFKDGDLLYMSEPRTLGIVQVAGVCTGFSLQK
jgi:hypothetical protein